MSDGVAKPADETDDAVVTWKIPEGFQGLLQLEQQWKYKPEATGFCRAKLTPEVSPIRSVIPPVSV